LCHWVIPDGVAAPPPLRQGASASPGSPRILGHGSHPSGGTAPGGGGAARVDSPVPGQAQAAPDGRPDLVDDPGSGLVAADDLPDGLVVADAGGSVTVFNRAARRLTGILPARALGQDVRHVLPLQDSDGRNWWAHVRPYHGLSTRTRHPERS